MGRKGSFGSPLNLGENINSFADDVTPYYNKWTEEYIFLPINIKKSLIYISPLEK